MAKYLFIYRNPPAPPTMPSPEEMQAVLAQWGQWLAKFAATGNVIDGGDGLQETGKLLRSNGVVSDGPFVESKEILGGYSIIQAESYDHALTIAKECPAHLHGGTIEIRELAGFN